MSNHRIGIIGGSGLYHIEGFTGQKWVKVKTPFGSPSDDFLSGKLAGRDDHDLCRRCWQKRMQAVRAKEMQELPDQAVE